MHVFFRIIYLFVQIFSTFTEVFRIIQLYRNAVLIDGAMYFWFEIFELNGDHLILCIWEWIHVNAWPVSCCSTIVLWVMPYLLTQRYDKQMSLIKLGQSLWPIYVSLFSMIQSLWLVNLYSYQILSGLLEVYLFLSSFFLFSYTQSVDVENELCTHQQTNTHHTI